MGERIAERCSAGSRGLQSPDGSHRRTVAERSRSCGTVAGRE